MTFAENILNFYQSLKITTRLPKGVEVLNPYQYKEVFGYCEEFYHRFYGDQKKRKLILGINPGRFGAGLTGIPFTDPLKLVTHCGIVNALPKKGELSADFIYMMIEAYGGLKKFYTTYYISSVSPLGFVMNGKNLNYYDQRELEEALHPFIVRCLTQQLTFSIDRSVCYCLGEGKNYEFLMKLNQQHQFFKSIVPLAHPRFIMQYRRRAINDYIRHYTDTLS
ncbi:MAG: DUF4918 family protein [Cyclobacteriaceae bacterium]|jgi:hypothetical protein|nr:DUF4918 family protein [Cyclobacteriaceae bacterium]